MLLNIVTHTITQTWYNSTLQQYIAVIAAFLPMISWPLYMSSVLTRLIKCLVQLICIETCIVAHLSQLVVTGGLVCNRL